MSKKKYLEELKGSGNVRTGKGLCYRERNTARGKAMGGEER